MTMDDPDSGQGRQPRVGESGAPVGSILSIVLAVVAVIVGFVILKQINDDEDGGAGANSPIDTPGTDPGNEPDETDPTNNPDNTTTSTRPPGPVNTFKGAKVVVANANRQGGTASEMSDKLGAVGFTMGGPTDATGDQTQLDKTRIYYRASNERARAVAETVGRSLGGRVDLAELPAEIPVDGGEIDGAVLVMLGTDKVEVEPEDLRGN